MAYKHEPDEGPTLAFGIFVLVCLILIVVQLGG